MGGYSYKNLLDYILELEENPEYIGKIEEQFKCLLTDYFLKMKPVKNPLLSF